MKTYAYIRHIEGTRFQVTGGEGESLPNTTNPYPFFMQGVSSPTEQPSLSDQEISPPTKNISGIRPNDNSGIRPMESVLAALATCSSIDVVSILKKSKQTFKTFEVKVSATRREAIPNIFTDIELTFIFTDAPPQTQLQPQKVERAIDLSVNKYCSVATMLKAGGVTIRHSLQINPS